jgi:predicted ATPase
MEKIKHNDIKFIFKNIGAIEYAEVPLNDLTMIVGKNSTSKTYLTYIIWGFLDFVRNDVLYDRLYRKFDHLLIEDNKQLKKILRLDDLLAEFRKVLSEAVKLYKDIAIPRVLAVTSDSPVIQKFDLGVYVEKISLSNTALLNANISIDDTKIDVKQIGNEFYVAIITNSELDNNDRLDKLIKESIFESIFRYLFDQLFPQPFIITSERTGISIFYKELDTRRSGLIEALADVENQNIGKDINTLIKNISRYPVPVSTNMDFIRNIFDKTKSKSEIGADLKKYILQFLTKGRYSFDKTSNQIFYTIGRGKTAVTLPIYIASSSVKSLLMLDTYINYIAQTGQILIIDEPELNLHPDNLRHMARLLAMLVNNGVKLLFTTHSDYIIKELNNLIMLESLPEDARNYAIKQIKKETKAEYQSEMFLSKDKVTCIIAKQDEKLGRVKTEIAPINEFGIDIDIIDREINYIGETSDILSELVNVNHRWIGE